MSERITEFCGDDPLAYITHQPETISVTVHRIWSCAEAHASEGWPVSYLAPQLVVDDPELVALCDDARCAWMVDQVTVTQ